jgi:hypothetical protein
MPKLDAKLRLLLVFALLHQLGAGACGCAEHNGWLQTGKAISQHFAGECSFSTTCNRSHGEDSNPSFVEHDCDGGIATVCVIAKRSSDPKSQSTSLLAQIDTMNWVDTHDCVSQVTGGSLPIGAAPPVRAALQVFRL